GLVVVLLSRHLSSLDLTPFQVGAVVTATLLGSAALIIAVGAVAHRIDQRRLLLAASALMALTGVGFYALHGFWPLLLLAVVGTLNPTGGDVSVFLPTEQSVLAESIASKERTYLFALYGVLGSAAGALGSLLSPIPHPERVAFLVYAGVAVVAAGAYLTLPPTAARADAPRAPLQKSRKIVLTLSALFSLDSFGGGFAAQALLV